MKTITATVGAWLTEWRGPDDLAHGAERAVTALAYSEQDMTRQGWTRAGEATITVEIVAEQELVDNKVAALREELKTERVKADMKLADIELKIQKLLAITYTPEVVA